MSATVTELKASDLNTLGGVYCPSAKAGMQTWNTHPKVFIDIAKHAEGRCHYCGNVFKLAAGEVVSGGH